MDREEERAILEAVLAGRKELFGAIVRHYQPRAYTVAVGLVGNSHDANDLCQEAFLRAWRARKSFDLSQPFFPWFYRILRNVCLSHLDRGSRRRFLPLRAKYQDHDEEVEISVPEEGPGPDDLAERSEECLELYGALQSLPLKDREILHLRHLQEMAYAEIAETLEIPVGTVMSRLHYARKKLRERMEAESR